MVPTVLIVTFIIWNLEVSIKTMNYKQIVYK